MSKKASRKKAPKKATKKAQKRTPAKKAPAKQAVSKKAKPAKRAKAPAKRARKPASSRARAASAGSPAPAARSTVDQLVASIRFAASYADNHLNAIPDEHALTQLAGADNHLAWTLGHQAISRAWFASSLSGSMPQMPDTYNGLFGMNSRPSTDPGMYPPLDELRSQYNAALQALLGALASLTDADLATPSIGDSSGFLTTKLDAAVKAAWHEGWHGGQLATLRRGLGIPTPP